MTVAQELCGKKILEVMSIRICSLIIVIALISGCTKDSPPSNEVVVEKALPPASYVGRDVCVGCHADESRAWLGSHHSLAMQHATAKTVLGNFDNTVFENHGVTSRFFRRGEEFWVETDNEKGELEEFKVAYTFGVSPLQQYLVEFDHGRIQTLPVAWDVTAGRWFHVYGDEFIGHDDPLHWTGREQNWNYMCAECHSTNLEKNYDVSTETFKTTWSEINVSCEACHGPASNHVTRAQYGSLNVSSGLLINLDDHGAATWQMNPETGIAERQPMSMSTPAQPEACGRCHSRRGLATGSYEFGQPLADTHTLSLLDDPLYFADGQIRDEVYVYGSFVQSKMYRAGVTCSDCHDPHTATLKTAGKPGEVCSTCHLPSTFNTESHHHHAAGTVECVDCHMPSRNYMVVDPRRDHSFRVPRPDLTSITGAPNTCNQCHTEQNSDWAAMAVSKWYGLPNGQHFSLAFHAARNRGDNANAKLQAVLKDRSNAGIVRATALTLLVTPLTEAEATDVLSTFADADPLVRVGALRAVDTLPPQLQIAAAAPLLQDPVRAVRLAAVDVLSPRRAAIPPDQQRAFELAEREYIGAQLAMAERPEAMANLGNLFRNRGDFKQAEAYYRYSLHQQPTLVGSRANLADLFREMGRDAEAYSLLTEGIGLQPDSAPLRHVLGLTLIRLQRPADAMSELAQAAELDPANERYAYVYGIGLNSIDQPEVAIDYLRRTALRFPGNVEIGMAYVSVLAEHGQKDAAMKAAIDLQTRFPDNPQISAFVQSLSL